MQNDCGIRICLDVMFIPNVARNTSSTHVHQKPLPPFSLSQWWMRTTNSNGEQSHWLQHSLTLIWKDSFISPTSWLLGCRLCSRLCVPENESKNEAILDASFHIPFEYNPFSTDLKTPPAKILLEILSIKFQSQLFYWQPAETFSWVNGVQIVSSALLPW